MGRRVVDLAQYLNDQAVAPPSAETKQRLRVAIAELSDSQYEVLVGSFSKELVLGRLAGAAGVAYTSEDALEDLIERPVPAKFLGDSDHDIAEVVAHWRNARAFSRTRVA